jgi:branched-chain amino acid transport system substrate-binding protein
MVRRTTRFRSLVGLLAAALVFSFGAACGGDDGGNSTKEGSAAGKDAITVGVICPRTGPIEIIGTTLCLAAADYVELVNSKGGVSGHPIKVVDIDYAFEVPKGVAAYEEMKRQGAVALICGGTPIALALNDRITADKIPCLTPGFGIAEATDGAKYPYQFPLAASYFSQSAAVLDHIAGEAKDKKVKVAFLHLDNPSGKEPLPALEQLAKEKGYEFKAFAVPLPGLELGAQITDIVSRYKADWVVSHLFGRAPSVSIKGLKQAGFPLDHVISFVWGVAEADIEAAGGFAAAEGYRGLQFTGVGQDFPVIKEIQQRYEARKVAVPAGLTKYSVYYNRGVAMGAMVLEGIRRALETGGAPVTGEKVKAGLESIKDFELGGLVPPLSTSPADHEGGGFTRVVAVKDGKLTPITDWDNPERDKVLAMVKARNGG